MSRENVKKFLIGGALVLAFALVFGNFVPRKAGAEEASQRIISVTGQAEMTVKPDMATLNFGVETNAPTAQEAQAQNSVAMNKVIAILQASGIAKEDIQTSNFSLFPVYEYQGEKPNLKQVVSGYRCNNTVTVRVKDISNTGAIIDAATKAGATNIGGISFGLVNSKSYEDQMLAKAVQNAREKAEIMARAAGVQITGIARMSDGSVSVSPAGRMFLSDAAYGSTPVEPGQVTIRASVSIDFTF